MHVLAAGRVDAVGGLVAGAALHRGYRPVVLSHASPRILGPHLFFFNDTATTEIYTLSLHDALPISCRPPTKPNLPATARSFSFTIVSNPSIRSAPWFRSWFPRPASS